MPHPEEETMQQRGYTPVLSTRTLTAGTANKMHMEPRTTRATMGTDDAHERKTRDTNQAGTQEKQQHDDATQEATPFFSTRDCARPPYSSFLTEHGRP